MRFHWRNNMRGLFVPSSMEAHLARCGIQSSACSRATQVTKRRKSYVINVVSLGTTSLSVLRIIMAKRRRRTSTEIKELSKSLGRIQTLEILHPQNDQKKKKLMCASWLGRNQRMRALNLGATLTYPHTSQPGRSRACSMNRFSQRPELISKSEEQSGDIKNQGGQFRIRRREPSC